MSNIFDEEKYKDAAQKCLEFMKRQLNVNNFQYGLSFGEEYSSGYQGDVIWSELTGLSKEEDQVFPKYISCDKYYDYKYVGQVSGSGPSSGGVRTGDCKVSGAKQ